MNIYIYIYIYNVGLTDYENCRQEGFAPMFGCFKCDEGSIKSKIGGECVRNISRY